MRARAQRTCDRLGRRQTLICGANRAGNRGRTWSFLRDWHDQPRDRMVCAQPQPDRPSSPRSRQAKGRTRHGGFAKCVDVHPSPCGRATTPFEMTRTLFQVLQAVKPTEVIAPRPAQRSFDGRRCHLAVRPCAAAVPPGRCVCIETCLVIPAAEGGLAVATLQYNADSA